MLFFPCTRGLTDPQGQLLTILVSTSCANGQMKSGTNANGDQELLPKIQPFTTEEFEQYLYLIFLNGLHPSPQIEWKLQQEHKDPINSSGFLLRVLGNNATQWLREWKACFACQDPKVEVPLCKRHPNFKVDEFLRHLQLIFCYA